MSTFRIWVKRRRCYCLYPSDRSKHPEHSYAKQPNTDKHDAHVARHTLDWSKRINCTNRLLAKVLQKRLMWGACLWHTIVAFLPYKQPILSPSWSSKSGLDILSMAMHHCPKPHMEKSLRFLVSNQSTKPDWSKRILRSLTPYSRSDPFSASSTSCHRSNSSESRYLHSCYRYCSSRVASVWSSDGLPSRSIIGSIAGTQSQLLYVTYFSKAALITTSSVSTDNVFCSTRDFRLP